MALGKLWQAFFGKRTEAGASPETGSKTDLTPLQKGAAGSPGLRNSAVAELPPSRPAVTVSATSVEPLSNTRGKGPRRSTRQRGAERSPSTDDGRETNEITAMESLPPTDRRPAHPKRNAWSAWVTGRSIRSILDTQPGDGNRAVPLLEAIVCRSSPETRYIAIGNFELADPALSIRGFHKMVRQVGGVPVPIPGDLPTGLRHLAHTHGTVDLILLEEAAASLTNPDVSRWLDRVAHPGTLILQLTQKGKWETVTRSQLLSSLSAGSDRLSTAGRHVDLSDCDRAKHPSVRAA
ncbi:MAG: hypothetical protein EA381_05180 [Planctomycetaceae bacterium]|nr:MAG: hypothetical protein EA381_05180 [Planctomycetaceae bacterium]